MSQIVSLACPADHRNLPMQYRRMGCTDLSISIMGFGASPLGDVFGPVNTKESCRAVSTAIDLGINFFDVSPYYGRGVAEERLGRALKGKRDSIILATKCGRYGAKDFDFSSARIRHGAEESLTRLGTDHVDLLQAHDIEFGDAQLIIHETLPAMRRLQEEGKARYIGISGYPLKILMQVAESAPVDSILSYCRYDLLCNDLDTVLMPFATRLGIGVINASPLHMGMLTQQGAPDWHPALSEVHRVAEVARSFCREQGVDISELAIQFCLNYLRVASTLVGMSNTEQVQRNVEASQASVPLELLNQIQEILAPASNLLWPSGRAENHDQL